MEPDFHWPTFLWMAYGILWKACLKVIYVNKPNWSLLSLPSSLQMLKKKTQKKYLKTQSTNSHNINQFVLVLNRKYYNCAKVIRMT